MSIVLFSHHGVHYEGGPRGGITAIYVPGPGQRRAFPDLQASNTKEIAERYGSSDQKALWRIERGQVVAYGTVVPVLAERREALSVYLPEQLLPSGCTVYYFVFGDQWIVHGVRLVNDDGQVEWAASRLPVEGKNPADMIVEALSERLLEASDETYCIAVTNNEAALQELKEKLVPFGQEAGRLEALKPARSETPLYKHQNHSLIMMTIALLALMVVAAAGGWWLMQSLELREKQAQIKDVRQRIRQIQLNERIGYIRNPQEILARMDKALQQAPSSILNTAAQLGAEFGTLDTVSFNLDEQGTRLSGDPYEMMEDDTGEMAQPDTVTVQVQLRKIANEFLIDQENLAKSLLPSQPWVRDIKSYNRRPGDEAVRLEVVLRVE